MHVNLLPSAFLRRLLIRRQASKWGLTIALTSLVAGGLIAAQYFAILSTQREQSTTGLQSKDLHKLQADTQRMIAELKSLDETIASLQKARPEDRTLTLVGIASASAKKAGGNIQLKQVTTTQVASVSANATVNPPTPVPGGRPPSGGAAAAANDFVLEGIADNAAAIASFIETLRETGVFHRVDLTATSEATTAAGAARQFRVDCNF